MLKEFLGLQSSVGIEAIKEHVENDVIGAQIEALEVTLTSQIEDNQKDISKILQLKEELERLQVQLENRNMRYEKLLEVLS